MRSRHSLGHGFDLLLLLLITVLSGLVRFCLLASHHTCLQGLLYWPPTKNDFMMMGRSSSLYMTNSAFESTTSCHLTTPADETYQNGYFRQPGGLVWHNYTMRVVALRFIFEMTPLYGVVLWKIIFEPTVCRFKHFPKVIALNILYIANAFRTLTIGTKYLKKIGFNLFTMIGKLLAIIAIFDIIPKDNAKTTNAVKKAGSLQKKVAICTDRTRKRETEQLLHCRQGGSPVRRAVLCDWY